MTPAKKNCRDSSLKLYTKKTFQQMSYDFFLRKRWLEHSITICFNFFGDRLYCTVGYSPKKMCNLRKQQFWMEEEKISKKKLPMPLRYNHATLVSYMQYLYLLHYFSIFSTLCTTDYFDEKSWLLAVVFTKKTIIILYLFSREKIRYKI